MPEKLTLKYDDEFILGAAALPNEILEALYCFLERLAANPDSPELEAEPTSRGLWAAQFTRGYSIYWHVQREIATLTTLSTARPRLIEIRKLEARSSRSHRNVSIRS
jgi:hypothetical protein